MCDDIVTKMTLQKYTDLHIG